MSPSLNRFEQVPQGTRVFILGNGPSLKHTPLEKLIGEHSWGVNQVHLIYPYTTWRPTRITLAEMTAGSELWWPKILESHNINKKLKIEMYARHDAWWLPPPDPLRIQIRTGRPYAYLKLFRACTHHDFQSDAFPEKDKKAYAWHLPQICKYGGSIPMTIQLAVMHGYSEIYLLGCDLGFKLGKDNHFAPEYNDTHSVAENTNGIDEQRAWKLNESRKAAHELCARESPIPIYNATIGGELEAYPRVDFDSLF